MLPPAYSFEISRPKDTLSKNDSNLPKSKNKEISFKAKKLN